MRDAEHDQLAGLCRRPTRDRWLDPVARNPVAITLLAVIRQGGRVVQETETRGTNNERGAEGERKRSELKHAGEQDST